MPPFERKDLPRTLVSITKILLKTNFKCMQNELKIAAVQKPSTTLFALVLLKGF